MQAQTPVPAKAAHAPRAGAERAYAWVRRYARQHTENFSVMTWLVRPALRNDFAAVYAFCRYADDLGDSASHTPDRQLLAERMKDLGRARGFLRQCASGNIDTANEAELMIFSALGETIRTHALPLEPFEHLLDAFEQDQRVTRYVHWNDLIRYCARSANPVGRIVLMLHGVAPPSEASREVYDKSDAICTALQLTNFWQDVRRDLLENDRVYLPSAETAISESELREWLPLANRGQVRTRYAEEVKQLVRKTWTLFAFGGDLPRLLPRRLGWMIWLFQAGGEHTLRAIEHERYITLWRRPRVSRVRRVALVARAVSGWALGLPPPGSSVS